MKLGYAITRVPIGPQQPVAVEKPSALLEYIQPDRANGAGDVSLTLCRTLVEQGPSFRRHSPMSTSTEKSESGRWEFQSSKTRCKTIQLSL